MREMCYFYSQLGSDERSDFLIYMATSLSIDHNNVQELIQQRPQASLLLLIYLTVYETVYIFNILIQTFFL